MSEDLFDACMAQPLLWLAVEQPVDEISSFQRPLFWNLLFAYLRLPCQHFLSYLLARPPSKGATPQHQLVGNDSNSEVVSRKAVILAAKHLWRHIARSAASVGVIVRSQRPCHTEVSDTRISLSVQDDVLRFNIAMDHSPRMQIPEPQQNAYDQKFSLFFAKFSPRNVVPKITPRKKIQQQIEVLTILVGLEEVNNEGTFQGCQQCFLVHYAGHTFLGNYSRQCNSYSAFDISLRAKLRPVPLTSTRHTFPNPPLPTTSLFYMRLISEDLASRGEGQRVGMREAGFTEELGWLMLIEQERASGDGRREVERLCC